MAWTMSKDLYEKMVDNCVDGFPLEACGLFLGPLSDSGIPTGEITHIWPATNIEKSARLYSVDPKDLFEATNFANDKDWEIVGVYHSHTHTKAHPSPTDIEKAVDPNWCYAIVSLEEQEIQTNYFKIVNGDVVKLELVIS